MPWIEQQLIANGVSAEGRVVANKALLEIITNDQVLTCAVNAGGTGYAVGETFDIDAGTAVVINGVTIQARGRVTSESAGVVTGVEILSSGAYSTLPGVTGQTTSNSSAAGNDDLTVDLTTQTAQWTQDSSSYTDLLTLFEWLATSVKATNAPTIGGKSILSATNDALQLNCASGYDGGAAWNAQPGTPPTNVSYVNCPNQDPLIYVSVTERRVNFLLTDGTFKQYGGMGLFIPITDVAGNYPFPGFLHGNCASVQAFNTAYSTSNRGVVHPIDAGTSPYLYRNNLSTEWFGITENNGDGADTTNKAQIWPFRGDEAVWEFNIAPKPAGSLIAASDMNPYNTSTDCGAFDENEWFAVDAAAGEIGSQGPQPFGPGNQLHFTVVPHIISNKNNESMVIGLLDGWEAVHGRGLNAFDEIATESGRRYLVFNDTNTTVLHDWVAMEKM